MKHWVVVATISAALFLMEMEHAHAGGRGGGTGGAMNKLSGPGPFVAFGGTVGAPFMCFLPIGQGCDKTESHPAIPLWLDLAVIRFWGESDFEGTNVDGWVIEPSVEWGRVTKPGRILFSHRRLFANLGFGFRRFRGDNFPNFWRSSINGRIGYKFSPQGALRGAIGISRFLTPFTHREFDSTADANDKWVWSFQISYLVESLN